MATKFGFVPDHAKTKAMCWCGIVKQTQSSPTNDNTVDHYNDVIISVMASQITSLTIVYSTVYSGVDQRKHQSSVSLAFVWGIHRSPVNSPHKGSVTRKMLPFDDVIMPTESTNDNMHGWHLAL